MKKFTPTVLVVQPERELRWLGRLFIPGMLNEVERSFQLMNVALKKKAERAN